ncbi:MULTISPECIES: flavodoxin family protein [Sphingobium]|uniref:Multimeric flavodoxin WrbA n=2 Tax=Sphingobium cupriresistens TaxID=1132417 RepID=A0A0J7Y0X2_9SPHN|nr:MULTISPECIES: NAD(P)H-dependent oxidoreductase [Sphingobium]KMS57536.1 multimeric flavodoxin WrbA [Sphingobium cupriresistens LL01]MBJ7376510.1 NAD(P)H-dependent oxidoreductase [Sphingobium sp.]RYM15032.1 NADPH-dependent oxidoreductase [Sphingobium cupriresistens]WCP14624.1 8-demethyl-8-aminoriboflavin-5'-phosphate synthase [Sphingobium sp. AntQ-1]
MAITVQPLNCTLKRDTGEPSSTEAMIAVLTKEFEALGVEVADTIRVASRNVLAGVTSDEGEGDDWPAIRAQILAADILILGTPIWMGQAGSVAKRALERMDAFLSETDDQGRMPSYGKVAVAAIVGNEDGAHAASAQIFQALNDVGWTIPAVAACYWVGEAMGSVDFKELKDTPKMVAKTAKMVAGNAAHLAALLKANPFPGEKR